MSDSDNSDWSDTDSSDNEEESTYDTTAPKPIKLSVPAWDAKFHPTENLVVAGDLDGVIKAWKFDEESKEKPELTLEEKAHEDTIRGLYFSPSGDKLFSIGTDKQLLISDVSTGKPVLSLQDAFENSPYCICSTNENVIATGDENGIVRLFDIRKKNPIDDLLIDDGRCEDTIRDIYISNDGKYLLAASGDGTLSTYNCKRKMFLMDSESFGSDLCSVIGIRNETKALVTASDGMIQLYNWKEFGHPSDMFSGHIKGDLVACKMNEQVILTGDVKGCIRAVNILPNRILETVGTHKSGVPIERLDVFNERLALSLGTGSEEIRFWNLDNVKPVSEGSKESRKKAKETVKKGRGKSNYFGGFENDLEVKLEENYHSSEDENSDEENLDGDEKSGENEDTRNSETSEVVQKSSEIAEKLEEALTVAENTDTNVEKLAEAPKVQENTDTNVAKPEERITEVMEIKESTTIVENPKRPASAHQKLKNKKKRKNNFKPIA